MEFVNGIEKRTYFEIYVFVLIVEYNNMHTVLLCFV